MPSTADILRFFRGQLFETPSAPTTSLTGKTFVITGANTGLGFECAKQLAALDASMLILGCRNMSKGEAAKERLLATKMSKGTAVEVWQIDMANYDSVKVFAKRMQEKLHRLDGIIANAGISMKDFELAEEFESTLTVNVISTFLLALLALPQLEQTANRYDSPTHLTIVGSAVHYFAAHAQLQSAPQGKVFRALSDRNEADMGARYFLSKLIVMQCVQELAKRVPDKSKAGSSKIIINCVNPGWCKTELFRNDDGGAVARILLSLIGRSGEVGARTLTHAVMAGGESHGRYLSECQIKPTSAFVRSQEGEDIQITIWAELSELLDTISPGVTVASEAS